MIREARASDRDAIQRLYEVLCPGEPVHVLAERIEQIHVDARNHLLVVEENGAVVATAFLTICLDAMFGVQPYGVVENVVVDGGARGHGVGTRLLARIEAMCHESGCSKIMLLSNAKRSRAHAFFARMGYSHSVSKGFKKYLGAHGPSRVERD